MRGIFRSPTLIMFMALFLVSSLPPMAKPDVPPASGDWDITSDTIIDNETATINGNINVRSGASLTIRNSNLRFNVQFFQTVKVEMGAGLKVVASNITGDVGHPDHHSFHIYDNCSISGSNITGCNLYCAGGSKMELDNDVIWMSALSFWGFELVADGCSFVSDDVYSFNGGYVTLLRSWFLRPGQEKVPLPANAGPAPPTPSGGATIFNNAFHNASNAAFMEGGQSSMAYPFFTYYIYTSPPSALSIDRCSFASAREAIILGDQQSPSSGIALLNNSFVNCSTAALLSANASRFCANTLLNCTNGLQADGLTNGTISNNSIVNCTTGIRLEWTSSIEIHDNWMSNCTTGIYCGLTDGTDFRRNTIENCSVGIDCPSPQAQLDPHLLVMGNTVSDCLVGLSLRAGGGEISNNTIVDCSELGLNMAFGTEATGPMEVRDNSFVRCGCRDADAAAMYAQAGSAWWLEIAGNRFIGESSTAVTLTGPALMHDNVINGSRTGILLNRWLGSQPSRLTENDINVSGTGIWSWEQQNNIGPLQIEKNRISSGGGGVVLVRTPADVRDNTFGQISDFCVRSIGFWQPPGNNCYPSTCAGRFRQEWYVNFVVRDESYVIVAGANVSCRHANGTTAAELVTMGDGTARCTLGQYLLDASGARIELNPYCVTAAKPGVGIDHATVNMSRDSSIEMLLHPLSDLYIQSLELPERRLQPGALVLATASIGIDITYNTQPRLFPEVPVLFQLDGCDMALVEGSGSQYPVQASVFLRPEAGSHTFSVIIDPYGLLSEAFEDNNRLTVDLSVNEAPVASLQASSTAVLAGDEIFFCANGSKDDRNVATYFFDFGDGEDSGWTNSSSATHAYARPGTYSATLEVMDDEGLLSEWTEPVPILVSPRPLNVTVHADRQCVPTFEPVMFWANVSDLKISLDSYRWDFGDGDQGYSRTFDRISHSYRSFGEYLVKVTVTDEEMRTAMGAISITVQNRRPAASILCVPKELTVLTAATFVSDSRDPDGYLVEWRWEFGDGEGSFAPTAVHTYPRKGSFDVTLKVQDDSGDWSEPCTLVISVRNAAPLAHARASAAKVLAGGAVTFDASASTDPDDPPHSLTFSWRASDGWTAMGPNVTRRFDRAGIYYLCLTVLDPELAETTTGLVVTVEEGPAPAIGVSPFAPVAAVAVLLAAGAVVLHSIRRHRGRARRGMPPRRVQSFPPSPPQGRP